jgi:hypothetical protein
MPPPKKGTRKNNKNNGTRKMTQAEKFALAKAKKNAEKAENTAKRAANNAIRAAELAKTSAERRAEVEARLKANMKAKARFIKAFENRGASASARRFEGFARAVEREANATFGGPK